MKILIVSGFLGSGKTEFIKNLVKNTNKSVVILENEFGEENLDGEYLKDEFQESTDIKVWELTKGCICCSVNLDLTHSILTIANTLNPDYLVIEPSGVAKISNLIEKIRKISYERIELGMPILILDAYNLKLNITNNKKYINDSVKYAGLVVLSKSEHLEENEFLKIKEELKITDKIIFPLSHYRSWEKEIWENILEVKLLVDKKERLQIRFSVEKRKKETFEQLTFKKFSLPSIEYLELILFYLMSGRLGKIDRVKGYLKIKEVGVKFDLVGQLYSIVGCENVEENKAVFIGENLDSNKLKMLLDLV